MNREHKKLFKFMTGITYDYFINLILSNNPILEFFKINNTDVKNIENKFKIKKFIINQNQCYHFSPSIKRFLVTDTKDVWSISYGKGSETYEKLLPDFVIEEDSCFYITNSDAYIDIDMRTYYIVVKISIKRFHNLFMKSNILQFLDGFDIK